MEVLAPVRRLRARRELPAARRTADAELLATALPSPRFAWRTNELCSDEHRRALAESLVHVVHASETRYLPSASPLNRVAAREQLALLLPLAAVLADTARRVPPRGVLLVEQLLDRLEEPALSAPPGERAAGGTHGRAESARGTALTSLEPEPRPRIKRLVVGRPKSTGEFEETLLPKRLALPIFASDALSSVAYATEAALVVLLAASATGRSHLLPVSIAIAALLAIVVVSYQQTVRVYESSGGAYVVAKDNLGTLPSLVGAAALLTDYVLTVAVSVAAGVVALASAVPSLGDHRLRLSLAFIALITLANLRGVRESGLAFAIPTYAFVASMLALVSRAAPAARTGSAAPRSRPSR